MPKPDEEYSEMLKAMLRAGESARMVVNEQIVEAFRRAEAAQMQVNEQIVEAFRRAEAAQMQVNETISVFKYLEENINSLNNTITLWESISPQIPSFDGAISPFASMLIQTRDHFVSSQNELVSEKKSTLEKYFDIVAQYKKLINKSDVKEPELQEFFEENHILLDQRITDVYPQKSFGGEKFPDFVIVLSNGTHVLVELEKPQDKIYNENGDPNAKFTHAEEQIREYLAMANEEKEFLRKRGLPNMCVENTRGLLIIGMSNELSKSDLAKLSRHKYSVCSTYEIKTFDDILEENIQLIKSLEKRCGKST